LGKIAFDRKDYANAKTALLKALATLKPDEQTAEAEYLVASIDYAQRNLDAALERCDRASQNSTSQYWSAKCVVLQSDIYSDKNDLFNARAALEAVIDNFKDDPETNMKSVVAEARTKLKALEEKEKKKSRIDPNKNNGLIELDNGK
jgi:predicted negative regulator of RcsB-dependent stress response